MTILLSLLIMAAGADALVKADHSDRAEVFRCDFGPQWDKNFDGWPAGWTREHRHGFPGYVEVNISPDPSLKAGRCLEIVLDGGAAIAYSPPIEVSTLYAYGLEGLIQTEGLVKDRAWFSIALLDEDHQLLETYTSKKIRRSRGWQRLRLGPAVAADNRVRYARIGLHLQPETGGDLKGRARFADLRMHRFPRLSLVANRTDHVYGDPSQIEIRCEASGFTDPDCPIDFVLEDELGRPIAKFRKKFAVRPAMAEGLVSLGAVAGKPPLLGSLTWKPPISGPGFYRLRCEIHDRKESAQRRELTLAVIRPQGSGGGEFGWSLPRGDRPLPLPALAQLLGQVGINWVKYPLWYGPDSSEAEIEQLVIFGDRLNARGIALVGLLNHPPDDIRKNFGTGAAPQSADIFSTSPDVWFPSLEPVLARLATRVRWWQLGDDRDTSFMGYPDLPGKIVQIKKLLDQVGQDVHLGMGWDWIHEMPRANDGKSPWSFLALSTRPQLAQDELAVYLRSSSQPGTQRWVSLEPLARGKYSTQVRVIDLIQRMIVAKMHGAERIFLVDPFDPRHGLMNGDGTVGELLLPWRTTALQLGATQYLGSIQLPGGSENHVFARDDRAMMVVWNDKPTREVIYLGREVRQIDPWGRGRTPPEEEHRQVIEVGPTPIFLTGVNKSIALWRIGFSFDHVRIPSVFGRQHADSFQVTNGFSRGVAGSATLVAPEAWLVEPRRTTFRLDAGRTLVHRFHLVLPYTADNGRHPVRVDFEVHADHPYRFSVYRHMDLGMGDVYIRVGSRMNDRGQLEVVQHFINETAEQVSFRCQLFVPNRRRHKTQVFGLTPGRDVKTYVLSNGAELIGKTLWLRAAEVDGPRILNYRFVVK